MENSALFRWFRRERSTINYMEFGEELLSFSVMAPGACFIQVFKRKIIE